MKKMSMFAVLTLVLVALGPVGIAGCGGEGPDCYDCQDTTEGNACAGCNDGCSFSLASCYPECDRLFGDDPQNALDCYDSCREQSRACHAICAETDECRAVDDCLASCE